MDLLVLGHQIKYVIDFKEFIVPLSPLLSQSRKITTQANPQIHGSKLCGAGQGGRKDGGLSKARQIQARTEPGDLCRRHFHQGCTSGINIGDAGGEGTLYQFIDASISDCHRINY